MEFKTVAVKEEDKKRIKDLCEKLNLKEYKVISKLLDYYEKLEELKYYLGCSSIEHLFHLLEEKLPKSKKQLAVIKTNQYIEDLRRLNIPKHVSDKLSNTIYKIIFDEW